RGVPYRKSSQDKLTVKQILGWARAHWRRTGKWPTARGGLIAESSRDTWHALDAALRQGSRGLRGGSSLSQLLSKRGRTSRNGSVSQRGLSKPVTETPLQTAGVPTSMVLAL